MKIIPAYHAADYDQALRQRLLSMKRNTTLAQRLLFFSESFLTMPYLSGALGEGPQGCFDQQPLYRHDCFDCVTYVNTVLALTFSATLDDFKQWMLRLNYYQAKPLYQHRFHFVSVDWNPNLQQQGILNDATDQIDDQHNHAIALTAETIIDRSSWLRHHKKEHIKLLASLTAKQLSQRLQALHALADQLPTQPVSLTYLPLAKLFDQNGDAIESIFQQIPSPSIIEIIRPNWPLREKIGTDLLVSHLGFSYKKENHIMFRHASQLINKVQDITLSDYLKKYLHHLTIKGIHIEKINPNKPLLKY